MSFTFRFLLGNQYPEVSNLNGFQRVEAHPLGQGSGTGCRLVREQIYQDGKLVRDERIEVCP